MEPIRAPLGLRPLDFELVYPILRYATALHVSVKKRLGVYMIIGTTKKLPVSFVSSSSVTFSSQITFCYFFCLFSLPSTISETTLGCPNDSASRKFFEILIVQPLPNKISSLTFSARLLLSFGCFVLSGR